MSSREALRDRVLSTCEQQGLSPDEAEEVFKEVVEALTEQGKQQS